MKTCIYARRSTLKQGQAETIENQIKICERKAKELGLTIVDIKTDSASGPLSNSLTSGLLLSSVPEAESVLISTIVRPNSFALRSHIFI